MDVVNGTVVDPPRTEVVILVASAGGFDAISRVLLGLPTPIAVPVVIGQHLSGPHDKLVTILSRRVGRAVVWAEDGAPIRAGEVVLCPPGSSVELLPDRTYSVRALESLTGHDRFDTLLTSAADAFGANALAVVLSGLGRDGTGGALAVRAVGGLVLVQDEESAEQPAMPCSVVAADAADRVLPVDEIGHVVAHVVAGFGLPPSASDLAVVRSVFAGTGEVARLARGLDWGATALGVVSEWPSALRTTLRLALKAPLAMCLLWGPDHVQLYNDAYRVIMGNKHPTGLGQANRECWPEVWHLNEGVYARVRAGEPVEVREALYPISRHGAPEDAWFDLFFVPVEDEAGAVPGILCTVVERTAEVLAARRLRVLNELTDRTAGAVTWRSAFERALEVLALHEDDVPFALGYRIDERRSVARLVHAVGLGTDDVLAPHRSPLTESWGWPLAHAAATGDQILIGDIDARFGEPAQDEGTLRRQALVVPLPHPGEEGLRCVLVLGLSPRLRVDERYEEFLRLVVGEVAVRLGEAHARERERDRLDRLAALDRAKTAFFSNVSHEFRTPLTLMLAPVEEILARADLPEELRADAELVRRNARRLLRLVGTLLDFSQAQAGRLSARFEPCDLVALTTDVVGVFRSSVERAGLALRIEADPLPEPVWLDPEMWEKILSNLLSNALKFTFHGEIVVQVRPLPHHVEVQVRDTGEGVAPSELPHLFKRFHRARGTKARTHEGAGIGLALTDELVRRHRGRIRVRSEEGVGTSFTMWLPLGTHSDPEDADGGGGDPQLATAQALAEEAAAWMPVEGRRGLHETTLLEEAGDAKETGRPAGPAPDAHVLVADDNPDMRAYLRRRLGSLWEVTTAADGAEALAAARVRRPQAVLVDVMMPNLDGLALVREIRADPQLRATPVVLLTARAGEDAAVDGLLAGADDYLTKPFSGRELVARLGAQIELARVRRQAEDRFRALINASWDVVYRMSPDWTEMRALDGNGFIADTSDPRTNWVDEYIPPEDRPEVAEAVRRAVESRGVFELEHRVFRPDGTIGWTLSRAVPLLDDDDEIVEWVGAASDVTERRGGAVEGVGPPTPRTPGADGAGVALPHDGVA